MARKDLSIAIVSYKTKKLLRECLSSIFSENRHINIEVFVADNCSNDGTVEMLQGEFPDVILIANNNNIGFAAASNQGLSAASGRYIMMLNPDTLIIDNALERLVAFLDGHNNVDIVAPRLLNADGSLQKSCRSFPNILNMSLLYLFPFVNLNLPKPAKYLTDFWDHGMSTYVDYAIGAALVLRKKCVEDIGYLDEKFFVYGEEKDYCYRLNQKGYRVYYLSNVDIIHYGGQSSAVNAHSLLYLHQSHIYYINKHSGYFTGSLIKLILLLGVFCRAFLSIVRNNANKAAYKSLMSWYMNNISNLYVKKT